MHTAHNCSKGKQVWIIVHLMTKKLRWGWGGVQLGRKPSSLLPGGVNGPEVMSRVLGFRQD